MVNDPYKYFRIEAAELLSELEAGMRELERDARAETIRALLRHAHTLKGASRVVKLADLGEIAHHFEDWLAPHRDDAAGCTATLPSGWRLLSKIREHVTSLEAPPSDPTQPVARETSDSTATLRVPVSDLDSLLDSVTSAFGMATALRRRQAHVASLRDRARDMVRTLESAAAPRAWVDDLDALADGLSHVHLDLLERSDRLLRELGDVRRVTTELRLVPVATLLRDLERASLDAAASLGKQVEFVGSGGDTDVDARVLGGLRTALVHLVRNAVAHGIETPRERQARGKAPRGRVSVAVERRGHRVRVTCTDDGTGIDVDAVRRAASGRANASGAAGPSDERAISEILLHGGVTTSEAVTGISGRGIGLDAVRSAIEALDGEVAIRSTAGDGVQVRLLVPYSLAAIPTLEVFVDGAGALLPLDAVITTLRVARADISRDASGASLFVDGSVVPFLPLASVLGLPESSSEMQTIVIAEALGKRLAFGVDRVGATRSVVVQAIPEHARVTSVVSGASLDDEGQPLLVLSVAGLGRAAASFTSAPALTESAARAPVLIVDDSLTTRMLEQSILESAGYVVDLAVSGEDALEKARAKRYGLFIVDVEMPGMGGLEFVARTRADAALSGIPSILVTSLSSDDDKRRGKQVGASAYIVKSEFDQTELLDYVRRFLG